MTQIVACVDCGLSEFDVDWLRTSMMIIHHHVCSLHQGPQFFGTVPEYVRIVESVWERGHVWQKVVANLGRRDVLESVLPLLNRLLSGDQVDTKQLGGQWDASEPMEVALFRCVNRTRPATPSWPSLPRLGTEGGPGPNLFFIAALAFLLDRMIERALRDAKVNLSATAAWQALQTIRRVRFRVSGEVKSGVTPGSAQARQVLQALAITNLRPPTPPTRQETRT